MKNNHTNFYKLAEYYDIAFGFRDVAAECDFLAGLVRRHLGREPHSFLELAAGPALHTIEFAKRGVRAAALDSVQRMLDYADEKARTQQTSIQCICSDMVEFKLPQVCDFIALLMDSSSYLLDNHSVLKHLNCVADHLSEGGVYVLEMSHPRDVFQVGKSTLIYTRKSRHREKTK